MNENTNHRHFELRRLSDDLVYQFDQKVRNDGAIGYRRQDANVWIIFDLKQGWIAHDDSDGSTTGRPWNVLLADQGDHPPEGEWISKKGNKSYVYELIFTLAP